MDIFCEGQKIAKINSKSLKVGMILGVVNAGKVRHFDIIEMSKNSCTTKELTRDQTKGRLVTFF